MKLLEPSAPQYSAERISIKDWAEDARPRERLMASGAKALSPAELLGILVGSGTPKEDAVTLMQRVLDDCNHSLRVLGRKIIKELCAYNGIGPAKAVTILAACELGLRHEMEVYQPEVFDEARAIYQYFYPKLRGAKHEEMHAIFLNKQLGFIRSVRISQGGIDATHFDVRILLREALACDAVHVALCHNHPSGNKQPSTEDCSLTERTYRACRAVDLALIDHIILVDGDFYSFAENRQLIYKL